MADKAYVIDQMISAKAIAARVEALAAEITAHFAGCDKLVVVGLLRVSFVFIADLVREIDLPVQVVAVPTVREPDGLALSSRNRYLTEEQRQQAAVLPRALFAGEGVATEGAGSVTRVSSRALDGAPGVVLDYLTLVDDVTFLPVGVDASGPARLLVAAWVGSTRLIDNVPLVLGTPDKG